VERVSPLHDVTDYFFGLEIQIEFQ